MHVSRWFKNKHIENKSLLRKLHLQCSHNYCPEVYFFLLCHWPTSIVIRTYFDTRLWILTQLQSRPTHTLPFLLLLFAAFGGGDKIFQPSVPVEQRLNQVSHSSCYFHGSLPQQGHHEGHVQSTDHCCCLGQLKIKQTSLLISSACSLGTQAAGNSAIDNLCIIIINITEGAFGVNHSCRSSGSD